MKGNGKKLSVFVMIVALAIFMSVAAASADGEKYRKTLHGEYAFTGSSACTIVPGGFYPNFTPKNPELAALGSNFWEGVYTFNSNGKGKMDTQQCTNDGANAMFPYSSWCVRLSWEFEYEIDGGEITFTFIPHTYSLEHFAGPMVGMKLLPPNDAVINQPWTGRISPDGKTLSVFYGGPCKLTIPEFGIELICNGVHQGFKTR
jgi:hypothetical protein